MSSPSSLACARSFDEALDTLAEQVARLGFDGVDYAYLPRARSADGSWIAPDIKGRNLPRGWRAGWAYFGGQDPYYRSAFYSDGPVDWDDVKTAPWLSQTQQDSIDYIADAMGFADGITVPVHLANGRFAFVSAAARRRFNWRKNRTHVEHELLVMAHSFHAAVAPRFLRHVNPPAMLDLKPREILCLQWAARGMNAPETAAQIHRSVETVRFHLKNAMAKLQARTIAHAVAQATLTGLIDGTEPHD